MADAQFKRNVAYKYRIGDLLLGKPIFDGDKFTNIELGDKKIVRVNLVGNIVERYASEGEKKFFFFTLDDGSGQIKLKAFGDDAVKFKEINQGQTVVVIGVMRFYNNELYVAPEIIQVHDAKYLLIRKMEIEKSRSKNTGNVDKKEIFAIRDQILEKIKAKEDQGGAEVEKLIIEFRETSPEIINQEIKKLLEEGLIFEPRPGKMRYLG